MRNFAPNEALAAPVYALLTIGVLTTNLGVVIGLTIEYGMIKREFVTVSQTTRNTVVFLVFLAFSGIWLAGSGAFMYLGAIFRSSPLNWMSAFGLALIGTLVLVPLKRVMPRVGSGVCVSALFNAVAYLSLVLFLGFPAYVPWGVLPVLFFSAGLVYSRAATGV